jgi:hypothetical protein
VFFPCRRPFRFNRRPICPVPTSILNHDQKFPCYAQSFLCSPLQSHSFTSDHHSYFSIVIQFFANHFTFLSLAFLSRNQPKHPRQTKHSNPPRPTYKMRFTTSTLVLSLLAVSKLVVAVPPACLLAAVAYVNNPDSPSPTLWIHNSDDILQHGTQSLRPRHPLR